MFVYDRFIGDRRWSLSGLAFLTVVVLAVTAGCRRQAAPTRVAAGPLPSSVSPGLAAATLAALITEEPPTETIPPTFTVESTPSPHGSSGPDSATAPPSPMPTSPTEAAPREPSDARTATPTSPTQATPDGQVDLPTPTLVPPTAIRATEAPSPASLEVTDARVVFHDGFSEGSVGTYEPGTFPWLDLLVQMGGGWYGPEREPDDGIDARPLPEGYRWEASGGFRSLPNGEAWWTESGTEGMVRLLDPAGTVVVELPLTIVFRSAGGRGPDSGPEPTPT